jgi:hypothetical protein
MPINVRPPEVIRDCFSPSLCTIIEWRQLNCWWCCLFCKLVAVLAAQPCSVPVGYLPHAFLQSIVCKSAVDCLKSWRAVLLLQDRQQEGTLTHTHTLFLACTSLIWLLYWLGTCVNFILNSEWSLALFSCLPHSFLQSILCRSVVDCLKSWRVVLLLQDRWQEGAFTCTHTLLLTCTSPIPLLYWQVNCVNFIPNSEWNLALFLSVVCPTLFCIWQSAGVQSIVWRAEGWHCFCRIGSGKAPWHALYFLLRLKIAIVFVP